MAKPNDMDEEMTVEITLENDEVVNCAVITILEVEGKDYIVLLPLDEEGNNDDGEVWFYRYFEDESDPNSEPQLEYIDDDDEYENVAGLGKDVPNIKGKSPMQLFEEYYESLKQYGLKRKEIDNNTWIEVIVYVER